MILTSRQAEGKDENKFISIEDIVVPSISTQELAKNTSLAKKKGSCRICIVRWA